MRPSKPIGLALILMVLSSCSAPSYDSPVNVSNFPYQPASINAKQPLITAEHFLRFIWHEGAQNFYNSALCHTRRCETSPDLLRLELYGNMLVPAGELRSLERITIDDYHDAPWNYIYKLLSSEERILSNEANANLQTSYWKAQATNHPLWIKITLTDQDGPQRVQALEVCAVDLGRPLPQEPAPIRNRTQVLLTLCQKRDKDTISQQLIAPDSSIIDSDTLMNALSELLECTQYYDIDKLRYLGGTYWYEGPLRFVSCQYQLSNSQADMRFKVSFSDDGYLHQLEFNEK